MTGVTVAASVRPRRRDRTWVCALWVLVASSCLHILWFGPALPVELVVLDLGMSVLFGVWLAARRRGLARRLEVGTARDLLVLQRRITRGEIPTDPVERAALGRLVRLRQERRRRGRNAVSLMCLLYLLVATWTWAVGDRVLGVLTLVVAVLYAVLAGWSLRRAAARVDRVAAALGAGGGLEVLY
ncbi:MULTISPECIES: hypothetical protein [unclassified Streptomyces]|uniref:hypothetical protein n=1 Tax=unclassified Streptomyces TaxID=2593676 RepID=UPI001F044D25|nr:MULTISPECIES: hypothetical protein [unclassified Streptomyces]MCH0562365.1 hypothetical protein [Streptomyces sp. MUM 2J]MCH0570547.1 hypothetical protein [Streptomyces sp. MUM 136J]